MSNKKFVDDLKFGLEQEELLLDLLQTHFKCGLTKTTNKSSWYDYSFGNNYYELKSRNNDSKKYPTTMIGYNKVIEAEKVKGDVYFIFNFTDKVLYIKYDKDVFDKFEIKKGGRYDRGKVEERQYIYIPVDSLEQI